MEQLNAAHRRRGLVAVQLGAHIFLQVGAHHGPYPLGAAIAVLQGDGPRQWDGHSLVDHRHQDGDTVKAGDNPPLQNQQLGLDVLEELAGVAAAALGIDLILHLHVQPAH